MGRPAGTVIPITSAHRAQRARLRIVTPPESEPEPIDTPPPVEPGRPDFPLIPGPPPIEPLEPEPA
jgi:hypothetical protein